MSFWLNENRCSLYLRKLSTTMRAAIVIVACSSLYAYWFVSVNQPMQLLIQKNSQDILQLATNQQSSSSEEQVTSYQLRMQHEKAVDHMQKKWTESLNELMSLFATHDIACKKVDVKKPKKRYALKKHKFVCSFIGQYKQIRDLLTDISEKLPNMRIAQLTLKRSEDDGLQAKMYCSLFNL